MEGMVLFIILAVGAGAIIVMYFSGRGGGK